MTEQELINKLEESGNCTLYLMKWACFSCLQCRSVCAGTADALPSETQGTQGRMGGIGHRVPYGQTGGRRQSTVENGHVGGVCEAGQYE